MRVPYPKNGFSAHPSYATNHSLLLVQTRQLSQQAKFQPLCILVRCARGAQDCQGCGSWILSLRRLLTTRRSSTKAALDDHDRWTPSEAEIFSWASCPTYVKNNKYHTSTQGLYLAWSTSQGYLMPGNETMYGVAIAARSPKPLLGAAPRRFGTDRGSLPNLRGSLHSFI